MPRARFHLRLAAAAAALPAAVVSAISGAAADDDARSDAPPQQGYTISAATGRLESRPASAIRLDVHPTDPARAAAVARFPFDLWVYGRRCREMRVSAHGWLLPGAGRTFADPGDPSAPHGQDPATGAFPYGPGAASADGVVAPLWSTFESAGGVFAWTSGEAPRRRFVVTWERAAARSLGCVTVQAQFHETTHEIVFAYASEPVTGGGPPARFVCGLDEPGGSRFTAPLLAAAANAAVPAHDFVLSPRCVQFHSPDAPAVGSLPRWTASRRESLRGDGGERDRPYVAEGHLWYWLPDRATRADAARLRDLIDEDRAAFPGFPARPAKGDAMRWMRQVLDGKLLLLPADGGPAERVWFRVIEWFSFDDRGLAGLDDHIWNVKVFLDMAFDDGDPRRRMEHWRAWRGQASARITVGKLFDTRQTDDAAKQFDSGRTREDALWCARVRAGHRGPMPDDDCPVEGWSRFPMKEKGEAIPQHADRRTVRFVPDPNYVTSGYQYVVRSDDGTGWIVRTGGASAPDEDFDADPPAAPR